MVNSDQLRWEINYQLVGRTLNFAHQQCHRMEWFRNIFLSRAANPFDWLENTLPKASTSVSLKPWSFFPKLTALKFRSGKGILSEAATNFESESFPFNL